MASIWASSPLLLQPGAVSSTHLSSPATPCCCGRRTNGRGTKAASSNLKQRKNCKNTEQVASRHLASTDFGLEDISTPSITSSCQLRSRVTARRSVAQGDCWGRKGHHRLCSSAKFRKSAPISLNNPQPWRHSTWVTFNYNSATIKKPSPH